MAKKSLTVRKKSKANARRDQGLLITGIIVAALVFVVVLIVLIQQTNTSTGVTTATNTNSYSDIPQTTTADGAPVLGDPSAKVSMLEFADFSCPHCLEYHPTILQVIDQLVRTKKLRLIYQPETFVGGQFSQYAAEAALCAGKQGHFWEMEDALFNQQETKGYQSFDPITLKQTANDLKINGDQVFTCMNNHETLPAINASASYGDKLGVNGTPSVLFSTDGTNYAFLLGPDGKPIIPSLDDITNKVNAVYSSGDAAPTTQSAQ